MTTKVLVAENEELNALILKNLLNSCGYEVHTAPDGEAAWQLFNKVKFDICLLDIMMPVLNGYELTTKIRKINKHLPILYVSGLVDQEDIIKGLETGADGYLVKPLNLSELVLRMEVFLKRAGRPAGKVYAFGNYILDMEKLTLTLNGTKVGLSMKELRILSILAKNISTIVSRRNILLEVWHNRGFMVERSLDILIYRIRKHLKADPRVEIETIRNVGYRLQVFDGIS